VTLWRFCAIERIGAVLRVFDLPGSQVALLLEASVNGIEGDLNALDLALALQHTYAAGIVAEASGYNMALS